MSDLAVDPTPFLNPGEEDAAGPLIPMVVSLTFPGMGVAARELQDELTRAAFDAVRKAGGRPRLVDASETELRSSEDVFAGAAAIMVLGGGDVDAACYGHVGPVPNEYGVDRRADDFCMDLLREAVARDLPTLAICRGSQQLNVAFGGTLVPDISEWEMHRGGKGAPLFVDEPVALEPGSKLAQIYGRTELTVRNGHHQAVAQVAPALRTTARARDGIVEATEHRDARWVVGVQWHPEEARANLADRDSLFAAFVAQAAEVQEPALIAQT